MESKFNKDYSEKIKAKLFYDSTIKDKEQASKDFNNLIVLLNYCFLNRNNFFIEDFNKKVIKTVCLTYNRIKTNVLTVDAFDLFDKIEIANTKLIRFIVINAINNYTKIKQNNEELCQIVSRDSLKRCLVLINNTLSRQEAFQS